MSAKRKTVFVSYAHEDRRWADELTKFLSPWIRDSRLQLWDDSKIAAGQEWMNQIRDALQEATVAVLLVTKDFLASEFIFKHELPILLQQAEKRQLRLIWVAVSYSSFAGTPLAKFQAANDPQHPLQTLSPARRDEVMVRIASLIADAATLGTFAGGFEIIDSTFEPIEAAVEKRTEKVDREFGVQAEYHPQSDQITFRGTTQTITAADLQKLPDEDREFIADLEDSLARNYNRWRNVRKTLGEAGGALDDEVKQQLKRIATLICEDLNNILDFLRKMHKSELEDHYGRYRHICSRLKAT
jgi:hypothetical protein